MKREPCNRCAGRGVVRFLLTTKLCPVCKGWGWMPPKEGE